MKKLLVLLAFVFSTVACAAETEKVCIKDAKGKEVCKQVKVHKKLEGTKVPEKK
jgi:hypothetical protein